MVTGNYYKVFDPYPRRQALYIIWTHIQPIGQFLSPSDKPILISCGEEYSWAWWQVLHFKLHNLSHLFLIERLMALITNLPQANGKFLGWGLTYQLIRIAASVLAKTFPVLVQPRRTACLPPVLVDPHVLVHTCVPVVLLNSPACHLAILLQSQTFLILVHALTWSSATFYQGRQRVVP